MKTKLTPALGLAVGSGLYDIFTKGIVGVDLHKAAFMAVFSFLLLIMIPKRFLENQKAETN